MREPEPAAWVLHGAQLCAEADSGKNIVSARSAKPKIKIDFEYFIGSHYSTNLPRSSLRLHQRWLGLLRPAHTVQQAEAVSPSVLQAQKHSYGKDEYKPPEPAIFAQVHEIKKSYAALDHGDGQHAGKHLRRADVLVGNDELHSSQD